jgi:hypothetical protein
MGDLFLHREPEEHKEVCDQDWPKHWNIKNAKERHAHAN